MKRVGFCLLFVFLLCACAGVKEPNLPESSVLDLLNEALDSIEIPSEIKEDIVLPNAFENDITAQWTSSNDGVISSEGIVKRPEYDEPDESIIIDVRLMLKGESVQKSFTVLVKKKELTKESINRTEGYFYQMDDEAAKSYPYDKGYRYAGLINKDGTLHQEFKENEKTGKTVNVMMFGAKAEDEEFDNTTAFQNAISACNAGDEVYVPKGKYYFSKATTTTPYYAHLILKEGVNIRGDGMRESILVSNYKEGEYVHKTYGKKTAILVCNDSNCTISDLGFTANTDDSCLPKDFNNTTVNNPEGNQYAPAFGIVAYSTSSLHLVENVYIHNVYVEYFQYDGIRLFCTRNCKIKDVYITKATDLGGGGAGYGIELRGYGHDYFQMIDTKVDSCFNIVEGATIVGPYIRHGIILSYLTHNNLFYNNTVLDTADDAIDVHGQDEFLNVFVKNYAKGSRKGAGLGLGNTGSSHDESGYGNVVFDNIFESCKYGITVTRGTAYTQLINNTIIGCTTDIKLEDAPNTTQENNIIK